MTHLKAGWRGYLPSPHLFSSPSWKKPNPPDASESLRFAPTSEILILVFSELSFVVMVVVSPPSRSIPLSRSPSPSASSSSSSSPSISSSIVYSSNGCHGSRLRIVSGIGVKPRGSLDPKEGRNVSLNLSGGGHNMGSIEENEERWIGGDGGRRMRRKSRVVMMCSAGLEGIGERRRELAREEGFVIPERAKVMAMVAMVLSLCNADRVVMSVAIVPLASRYGWSSSVLGIVQVITLLNIYASVS